MPITRAKASQLLNQKEMALYDESRVNGLRQLDDKAIATRITRVRAARDRARDLVQRQKLSSRASTGSKRGASGAANQRSKDKAELMADILVRFETRLREVGGAKSGRPARTATKKAAKKAAPAKKAPRAAGTKAAGKVVKPSKQVAKKAAKKAAAKTAASKRAGTTTPARRAAKKATPGQATTTDTARPARAAKTTARRGRRDSAAAPATATQADRKVARTASSRKAGASRSRTRKQGITPEQALAQTQALLEAKQARDQEPKPWADATGGGVDPGAPGYQSDSAARRARRLHAAESRLPAIQGSASTRDRINQGKRDHRGDTGD